MSIITKNESENDSLGTNAASGSPEPKTNSHTTINSRTDLHYPNFHNPPRIYQQNVKNSKIFRILTVLAYMVAVSTAAIILSIYYTFIWKPPDQLVSINSTSSPSMPQMPFSTPEPHPHLHRHETHSVSKPPHRFGPIVALMLANRTIAETENITSHYNQFR